MKTISWILLTLVACLLILGSCASFTLAYFFPSNDVIVGSTSMETLEVSDDVASALRGRRGTAAAFSIGFAILLLFVVLGPYRKGDVWAWWAILCSSVALVGVIVLRVVALSNPLGVTTGWILLIAIGLALLLDVRRLTGPKA